MDISVNSYRLILAFHVFGMLLWVGGLISLAGLLAHHGREPSSGSVLSSLERRVAMGMELGAAVSIITGLIMIFGRPGGASVLFKEGWFHMKLTLVVVAILGAHGFLRVKVRKFREGGAKPLPSFLSPVLIAAALGIIVLAIRQPFR